jgi:FAD/FMN-containing dehydrogenase
MNQEEIKKRLIELLGPRNVSDKEVIRESYQYMPFFGITWRVKNQFITLPESVEQVSGIMKIANEYRIPVTPRGSLGFGGFAKGILMDMTRLNRILKIDEQNAKAIAEGGCSFFYLVHELFKKGFILPTSEFGPAVTVAATAQNPAVCFGKTRYGRNSQLVEGLEVVLPTGEVVRVGSLAYDHTSFGAYSRFITGPDLVGLFTQGGGSFGIITKVAYRCLKKPENWGFYTYYWSKEQSEELTKAMKALVSREIFDIHLNDRGITLAMEQAGLLPKLPNDCWFILYLMVTAESTEELKAKESWVGRLCSEHSGKTLTPNLCQEHWEWPTFFQPTNHPIMIETYKRSGHKFLQIADSIYYPLSKFPEVYSVTQELCEKFSIVGNGSPAVLDAFVFNDNVICSQIWLFLDPYDKDWRKRMAKFHYEFCDVLGRKGATWQNMFPPLVPDWAWKNQESAHQLITRIKKLIDPNNILMPGNIYSVKEV